MTTPNTFKSLIESYHVEIPLLQRDYAQGRKNARTNAVRSKFVSELFRALKSNKSLELDFIYGPVKSKTFIPLDGQQRLTTLFLLHWYIAGRENKNGVEFSKFTYKVRTTTQEFLDALLKINGEMDFTSSPASQIKDASWYYSAWDVDPSVQGMLVMLDAIHGQYPKEEKKLWDNLSCITFNLLDMGEYGLTDDLYMKMNARGVPLTDFENFKAWLVQKVQEKKLTISKDWTQKLDKDWCDLFFKLAPEGMDAAFLRFFKMVALNVYIENKKVEAKDKEAMISRIHDEKEYISLEEYETCGLINEESLTAAFRFLDSMNNIDRGLLENVKLFQKTNKENKTQTLFELLCDSKLEYEARLLLYGLFLYLGSGTEPKTTSLSDWMRVVRNLTLNSPINASSYAAAVQGINDLFGKAKKEGVIGYLASAEATISGFNNTDQVAEEKLKAQLITKNENWREELIKAENHPLFKGAIGFLLIEESGHGELSSVASISIDLFQKHHDVAKALWDKNGSIFDREPKRQLLLRAMLASNHFPVGIGGLDWSNSAENWRQLLRNPKLIHPLCHFLKAISDRPEVHIKECLEGVCKVYGQNGNFYHYINSSDEFIQSDRLYVVIRGELASGCSFSGLTMA